LAIAAALTLTGCHVDRSGSAGRTNSTTDAVSSSGAFRLVAFNSCADVITGLNEAASAVVGPWGLPGNSADLRKNLMFRADGAEAVPAAGPSVAAPDHSATNVQEAGVDEPDLVKTDGRRIITVTRNELRIIDAATHQVTGSVDLRGANRNGNFYYGDDQILLAGDRALVINNSPVLAYMRPQGDITKDDTSSATINGPRLTLVNLAGTPSVLATYDIDGSYVDARQVGGEVRVVIESSPRVNFQFRTNGTDAQRTADNKKAISKLGVDDWLPRYSVTEGGATSSGHVPCDRVQRPTAFSATNMLTVLSFDLNTGSLGNGDPTTIVADGNTVYASPTSLYIASDERWRRFPIGGPVRPMPNDVGRSMPYVPTSGPTVPAVPPRTVIYRFDTSQPGTPVFAGAGSVPGFLVNSYAMSEWGGHLRVAVTSGYPWEEFNQARQDSSVYVLSTDGGALRTVGHVGGLGHDQRIYAVRFAGPVGYVVTFRQVDPLYTLDLSDPAKPAVRGEVELQGYSAYLHPIDDTHLLGVGQDADSAGHVKGTMLALFDVSDPAHPVRTAQTVFSGASSSAEFDPHAFLYWPATGSVVVPLSSSTGAQSAVAFRVTGNGLQKMGAVVHPGSNGQYVAMERSFVIGSTLWTLSSGGLMASDIGTLNQLAWLSLPQ
jgi:uncharacterized secreted protein with C-terminal beta-propeller domain